MVYSKEAGKNGVPQAEYYSPRGNLGGVNVPGGGLLSDINSEIGSLNFTTIVSNTLTNELFIAGAWFDQVFTPKNFAATTAFGAYTYQGLFKNGSKAIPTFEDYGNDGLPLSRLPDGSFGGIFAKKWIRTGGDNLTKVLGTHTIRVGIFGQLDTNHQVVPFINTNGTVTLYYFPETISDPVQGTVHDTGAVASGNGGNYLADFLSGSVQNFSQSNIQPAPNIYFWNIDGYAQDHWRIARHLTVDYGVRFDHYTPWNDAHGQGIPVFDKTTYATGFNPSLPGFKWHSIDPKTPNAGLGTRWAYVEPRVGFAWDAYGTGKTVVRGGFGIYRAHDSANDATSGVGVVEGLRSANVSYIQLSSLSAASASATQASGFVPHTSASGFLAGDDEQPQVYTYNFAVDQKGPFNSLFEIAYIGNLSRKILNDGSNQNVSLDNINALPYGSLYKPNPITHVTYPLLPPSGTTGTNDGATSVSGLSANQIDQWRPYPLYHNLNIASHNVSGNYNSLQVALNKQQGRFLFGVNYTFSKALGVLGGDNDGTPVDSFNYHDSYLPLSFDRTHIFNASYSYSVGNLVKNKFIGQATNGWEVSGITNIQAGGDFASQNGSNFALQGTLYVQNQTGQPQSLPVNSQTWVGTPDAYLQPVVTCDPGVHTASHQYVNGNCFALPALGQQGTLRLPYIHEPAYTDTDLTAAKDFKVHEGQDIQFKLAAFNFINHANTTFTNSVGTQAQALILNYSEATSGTNAVAQPINQAIATVPNANAAVFGQAPLRVGRRIVELSLHYSF